MHEGALTPEELSAIARRGQHPSQCPAETIRADYATLVKEIGRLTGAVKTLGRALQLEGLNDTEAFLENGRLRAQVADLERRLEAQVND
ncbi:hypothetical protein [Microbispora sp. NPDC049125]|uniref:hypothetical protein n=1 Tax=Microbispora sp. NPDC049125 TaxID=3154929 RepID=UPI0034671BC9